jgi:hypothetical protein
VTIGSIMKLPCLSLWQPWASAIFVPGLKPIETRHWYTHKRGKIALHAAKKSNRELRELFHSKIAGGFERDAFKAQGIGNWNELPLGAILGTVEIVDCVPTAPSVHDVNDSQGNCISGYEVQQFMENEKRFSKFCAPGMWHTVEKWGDFSPGRFGHCYANITKFAEPIPYKGAQGFFTVEVPA